MFEFGKADLTGFLKQSPPILVRSCLMLLSCNHQKKKKNAIVGSTVPSHFSSEWHVHLQRSVVQRYRFAATVVVTRMFRLHVLLPLPPLVLHHRALQERVAFMQHSVGSQQPSESKVLIASTEIDEGAVLRPRQRASKKKN